MSSEARLKKLRGSGGHVMAQVTDEQQIKGNLGGPDLFLAPVGRLDPTIISKYFCNTCEKEYEGSPRVEFENPNEEVAENLVLMEKGQYLCGTCGSIIAEYREFQKSDEATEVGLAKPIAEAPSQTSTVESIAESIPEPPPRIEQIEAPDFSSFQEMAQQEISQPLPQAEIQTQSTSTDYSSITGLSVYDENAKKIGVSKQVGVDTLHNVVLIVTKNDGTEASIAWNKISKIGEIILLGQPQAQTSVQGYQSDTNCANCGFDNKAGSKFCESCGTKL